MLWNPLLDFEINVLKLVFSQVEWNGMNEEWNRTGKDRTEQ